MHFSTNLRFMSMQCVQNVALISILFTRNTRNFIQYDSQNVLLNNLFSLYFLEHLRQRKKHGLEVKYRCIEFSLFCVRNVFRFRRVDWRRRVLFLEWNYSVNQILLKKKYRKYQDFVRKSFLKWKDCIHNHLYLFLFWMTMIEIVCCEQEEIILYFLYDFPFLLGGSRRGSGQQIVAEDANAKKAFFLGVLHSNWCI